MLRRKPGAPNPADPIDQELLDAIDAELPWRVLLQAVSCTPQDAAVRISRLLHLGYIEGTPDDMRPSSAAHTPVSAGDASGAGSRSSSGTWTSVAPRSSASSAGHSPSMRPSAEAAREALLRELKARRGGLSVPPPDYTRGSAQAEGAALPSTRAPSAAASSAVARAPAPSAAPAPARSSESAPKRASSGSLPPVYGGSVYGTVLPSTPPPSAPPSVYTSTQAESPLVGLIEDFSRGEGMQRWAAVRLREALEEERAQNYLQAVAILQVVMAQVSDPRLRIERDRLNAQGLQASSGVYRSRALQAEQVNRPREAAENWRKVLEAFPSDVEAALHAAACLMEAGDLKQAGHFARRATELAPESESAHQILLRFFKKSKMDVSAQREREIILKLRKRASSNR